MAYGDQPALICELDWCRSTGFDGIAADKGTKYLPEYNFSMPNRKSSPTSAMRAQWPVVGDCREGVGQAASVRATVYPGASSWRMWLRTFLPLSMRLA